MRTGDGVGAARGHALDSGVMSASDPKPNAPEPEVALAETDALLARFARTRDTDLREELVVRYESLATILARRYANRGENLDDLIQVARLGLLKALDGFDERRGTGFRAYAEPTILGELRRHFRDKRWAMRVPRELKEAIPKIRSVTADLSGELGRDPTIAEIAERMGVAEADVLEAQEASSTSRPSSLDAPVSLGDESAAPMGEQIGALDPMIDQAEWGVMLSHRLDRLDERDRDVLHLRFVEDLSQREIGERIGVSQMQVSRILRAALDRLREEV